MALVTISDNRLRSFCQGFAWRVRCKLRCLTRCQCGVQIALEMILGFDKTLLTTETIQSCNDAFRLWNEGLFSFPINLPGTGVLSRPSTSPTVI